MKGRFLNNLVNRAQYQVEASVSGWLVGGPPEEVALLNRLNERLVRNRICKVRGMPTKVVKTRNLTLHRKGPHGTDLYGCDLAVSFHVRHTAFLKTVFFQLKRGYRVPKRDLVSAVQVLLQNGRLKVAAGLSEAATLKKELLNFRVKVNPATAHDSYEHWREGDHDDLVLAVAMACWFRECSNQYAEKHHATEMRLKMRGRG